MGWRPVDRLVKAMCLSREEHRDILAEAVRAVAGRVPVVAGIISNSTAETAARGQQVADLGVIALQVTPPAYLFRPDDDAMVDHFRRIHGESGLPILIYNVVGIATYHLICCYAL